MSAAAASRRGLPGLAGGDHIGITVPNLDAALAFFVEVIGCEHITLRDHWFDLLAERD